MAREAHTLATSGTTSGGSLQLLNDGDSTPFAVAGLVTAAQRGDVKSFERLYRLYNAKVFGLCLRMTRQRETAEDCVQQTFINAWRNLSRFENRSQFSTWLHGIAVNSVLSCMRSRNSSYRFEDSFSDEEFESHAEKPDENTEQYDADDVADMERALTTLPDGARYVIVLHAVYGYSHEEVADMLNIAVGTCKAQVHRARRLLRDRLDLPRAALKTQDQQAQDHE